MFAKLTTIFGKTTTRKTFRPGMEALETRWCPSTTVSPVNNGHTLQIRGDNNANTISIVQNDNHHRLTVTADGVTSTFDSSDVTLIDIKTAGGNDHVSYTLGGGSDFKKAKTIQADLGRGANT